jgi:hypothetical protein
VEKGEDVVIVSPRERRLKSTGLEARSKQEQRVSRAAGVDPFTYQQSPALAAFFL